MSTNPIDEQQQPAPEANGLYGLDQQQSAEAAAPSRKYSRMDLTAGIIIVLAILGVFGLRRIGLAPAQADASLTSTEAPDTTPAAKRREADRLLAELARGEATPQARLDLLDADPFGFRRQPLVPVEIAGEAALRGTEDDPAFLEALARQREEMARAEMRDSVEDLTLEAVVGGRRPAARINSRLYRVGDRVTDRLILEEVRGRSVVLSGEGMTFEIEITRR